jgi:hypothetical protein
MTSTLQGSTVIIGTDQLLLKELRRTGIDHGGNRVEPFTDEGGDWPLRCCLTRSAVGDRLAIVNWSPFSWHGAYRTHGPIVIHADACPAEPDGTLPARFETQSQILRAYSKEHRLIYELNRLVEPGDGLAAAIDDMLADPRVDFVQSYNVLAGCYSFTAQRTG